MASTNFAYFYWYSIARTLYTTRRASKSSERPGVVVELVLGAAAGAAAQVCTLPVAVITTRQQTRTRGEAPMGLLATGREVVESEDGWTGLWRGLKASLVLVVNPAITYGAYERLRVTLFRGKASLRPWEAFGEWIGHPSTLRKLERGFGKRVANDSVAALGALSKAMATIVTQPLIVAKVGLQSRPPAARKGKPFKTFPEVMKYIVEHEGLLALFKGIGPQITKGLLVQGLLMMTKERWALENSRRCFTHQVRLRGNTISELTLPCLQNGDTFRPALRVCPPPAELEAAEGCYCGWDESQGYCADGVEIAVCLFQVSP